MNIQKDHQLDWWSFRVIVSLICKEKTNYTQIKSNYRINKGFSNNNFMYLVYQLWTHKYSQNSIEFVIQNV